MKRIAAIWFVSTLLSVCAFAVLLVEDRHLGVPLPYSLPLAFAVVLAIPVTPLLFSRKLRRMSKKLLAQPRVRRPAIQPAPVAAVQRPRRPAEGVVLLDFSSARRFKADAA
jgi:hypothetical protein